MRTLAVLLVVLASLAASPARADLYFVTLSGPAEAPPNSSPGTGTGLINYDPVAHTLRVQTTFSGLTTGVTAAHIHCCTPTPFTGTAGVATPTPTFPGFPSGVTAGTYDQSFNLTLASSWNAAYITANGGTPGSAEAAFAAGLAQGRAYLNIHTTQFGGGEIRGFLVAAVPEPSTYALLAIGLAGLGWFGRRTRRTGER